MTNIICPSKPKHFSILVHSGLCFLVVRMHIKAFLTPQLLPVVLGNLSERWHLESIDERVHEAVCRDKYLREQREDEAISAAHVPFDYKRTVAKEQGPYHESCGLCGPNILYQSAILLFCLGVVVGYPEEKEKCENFTRSIFCCLSREN